jgi:tRNA-2-methylthio-N6-dimethylallyladenosine synthase
MPDLGTLAAEGSGASTAPRRYFIETWGCQMNELDSQRLAGQLMQLGILPTRRADEADVILLNSCSVREKAEQKVYSQLGRYREYRQQKPDLLLGLCGCVAQQEGERALDRVKDLNFVLGTGRVGELADVVRRSRSGERVLATGFPAERSFDIDSIVRDGSHKGMVTVIEGCDKRCTFCVVPSTRGPERSRPLADVVNEVRHLLEYGFNEIELLGQTVNHWREPGGSADFADLLRTVAEIPGLRRLRFVTSYPRDFTPAMVEVVGGYDNICPYLHLPVQSGSDAILRKMGRGYDCALYLDLVRQLRSARPGLAITTDFIVGFPTETEEDFQHTLDLMDEVEFSGVFAFRYSPRPHTAAPRIGEPLPEELAAERLQRLLDRQDEVQIRLNAALVGSEQEVIVTGWGKTAGSLTSRTPCHRIAHFTPPLERGIPIGSLQRVQITRSLPHSLMAELLPA